MKISTLCFLLKEKEILLAMKKRGFGQGKWNGYGGKVENEEIKQGAAREVREEIGVIIEKEKLQEAAVINFYMADNHFFECHVFLVQEWSGTPVETDEMKPQWFALDQVPFHDMWPADQMWIPIVLSGKKIKATVQFDETGTVIQKFKWEKWE